MRSDAQILALLDRDPEEGMARLLEQYAGLVWTVSARALQNTEDTRECVNDVFAEFYRRRDEFDPEKGSLKTFLALIARRRSIDVWRAAHRRPATAAEEEIPEAPNPLSLEDRAALNQLIDSLPELDGRILRMKYYGGMSAREIAAALDLPYETVKKRHQRSLKKLRSLWVAGLVLALLALLAACAYVVLRYFGLVPGYGVNTDPTQGTYLLAEPVSAQDGDYEIQIQDALWQNGLLTIDMALYGAESPVTALSPQLEGVELLSWTMADSGDTASPGPYNYRLMAATKPVGRSDSLAVTLTLWDTPLSLQLTAAQEITDLSSAGAWLLTEEDGGLLAMPRLENGELIVTIYPLHQGEYRTQYSCNEGIWGGFGGPSQPITVTAPDGSVLTGEPEFYVPFDERAGLDWYFGPAESGEYTLNVPFVYQDFAGEFVKTAVMPVQAGAGTELALPGGTLTLENLRPAAADDLPVQFREESRYPGYSWWVVDAVWNGDDPERVLAALSNLMPPAPGMMGVYEDPVAQPLYTTHTEADGNSWQQLTGYCLGVPAGTEQLTFATVTRNGSLCYRWEHPFALSFTVEPETPAAEYTVTREECTLTAVPRRVNGAVTVSVYPEKGPGKLTVSPQIAHNPLPGATDEPVTLLAADGTAYTGTYTPGRDGSCSSWKFGNLPTGEYTLCLPSLYLTGPDAPVAVPLPQQEGESLPAGETILPGGRLQIGTVRCLGRAENFPVLATTEEGKILYQDTAMAIGMPDGSIVSLNELPLEAELDLTLQATWKDYTLLSAGVKFGATAEGSEGTACERQYTLAEDGTTQLSGLLLRYKPGLHAANLTFTQPLYRWDCDFTIPITIP